MMPWKLSARHPISSTYPKVGRNETSMVPQIRIAHLIYKTDYEVNIRRLPLVISKSSTIRQHAVYDPV